MALRGHASIQGSTDIPTLFNLLPGYLTMPRAKKDATYAAFREVGCVIRTVRLLRYLSDPALRRRVTAATNKDFPMQEAGVLTIGAVYMVVTLAADVMFSLLNPRIRLAAAE